MVKKLKKIGLTVLLFYVPVLAVAFPIAGALLGGDEELALLQMAKYLLLVPFIIGSILVIGFALSVITLYIWRDWGKGE